MSAAIASYRTHRPVEREELYSDENYAGTINSGVRTPLAKRQPTSASKSSEPIVMTTPRATRSSPGTNYCTDEGTPQEPNAPMKERSKSDPRKTEHATLFEHQKAKCLKFEDDRTLAPLDRHPPGKDRRPSGKSSTRKSLETSRRKGATAWAESESQVK